MNPKINRILKRIYNKENIKCGNLNILVLFLFYKRIYAYILVLSVYAIIYISETIFIFNQYFLNIKNVYILRKKCKIFLIDKISSLSFWHIFCLRLPLLLLKCYVYVFTSHSHTQIKFTWIWRREPLVILSLRK